MSFLASYDILKEFDVIPFYGTLLGLHRDGDIIIGDDDVDYLAAMDVRAQLEKVLIDAGYTLALSYSTFSQFKNVVMGEEVLIDIYYYTMGEGGRYLIEAWNFCASPDDPRTHYHIPTDLIFPLKTITLFDDVTLRVPNDLDGVCNFMFGPNWRIPYSKSNAEYFYLIHDNKPLIAIEGQILYDMKKEHMQFEGENLKLEDENRRMKRAIDKANRNFLKRLKYLFVRIKY